MPDTLFDNPAPQPDPMCRVASTRRDFDGETYDKAGDGARMGTQLKRVHDCMRGGEWWTLYRLAAHVRGSESGVSARIRDLRKPRFGGHTIHRRRVPGGAGLCEYRMEATR